MFINILLLFINNFTIFDITTSQIFDMRFFGPKSISHFFFYFFRLLAIGTALFVIYIDAAFLTGNFETYNGRYKMDIPLTGTFIQGDYQLNVIITISIGLLFGTVFFYMLSSIFHAFKAKVLFTKSAVSLLKYFALLNLVAGPVIYVLIHFVIMQKTNFRDIHNLILHLLIGIVALFVAEVFKKGFFVQQENDLTI